MRANGNDVTEIFGFASDDRSKTALDYWAQEKCPFTDSKCTKTNHDKSLVYGVCAVTVGRNSATQSEVVICPKRLYASNYAVLQDVADSVWKEKKRKLIVGGGIEELRKKTLRTSDSVVAFGQGSGREIQVNSNGQLSMDWVLQTYRSDGYLSLTPEEFVGVEVQSIDITGNYRDNWKAYKEQRFGNPLTHIPNSGHGLNWANVHKRLIPQIIRKGNIYKNADRCRGFFFIVPEIVFEKFEQVIGKLEAKPAPDRSRVSVLTYKFSGKHESGNHREIAKVREVHLDLFDIATAFITNTSATVSKEIDESLKTLL